MEKLSEAKSALLKCIGPKGFYAGNDYQQYWARDLGYSIDVLLELGYADLVKTHLLEILKGQRASGDVPTMVQTRKNIIKTSAMPSAWIKTLKYRGWYVFSNVTQYLKSLSRRPFHDWTTDSQMIFLSSVSKYEDFTKGSFFSKNYDKNMERILNFVESKIGGGVMKGAAWFDAMNNYNDKITFHNQVWLYKMYRGLKMHSKAEEVRNSIEDFWNEEKEIYADYLEGDHFDTLSHALALEEGLVPKEKIGKVLKMFQNILTEHGYLNLYPAYAYSHCTQYPHTYQNSTIWPFVEYRLAKVFLSLGFREEAEKIKMMMEDREGFNEWYSPSGGKPGGSDNQLWTICAYIGVCNLLQK